MTFLALSGIGVGQMLSCLGQLSQVIPTAPRRTIHQFVDILWRAAAREITPTPLALRVEINPALKTHYSARNRTFVITLSLPQSATDFMPQFVYGGGAVGPPQTHQVTQQSAFVQQTQQTRATRAELEAEKQMAVESHVQSDMLAATPTTELHPDGLQQRDQVVARADQAEEAAAEKVAQLDERMQQLQQAREIITHNQTTAQERELHDAQVSADLATTQQNAADAHVGPEHRQDSVQVGDEIRAGEAMDQAARTPTVESQMGMILEGEEKESDVAELRLFNQIMRQHVHPHVNLQVTRQPMIASAAEGDTIVMEVSTNSFRDTRRVNVNMLPITKP